MEKNNLSKQKPENHISKKKEKKISAEISLSNDMPKKKGTKTDPSNKSIDGEDFLADLPKGSKGNSNKGKKKLDAEDFLADAPKFKKSNGKKSTKLKPEGSLSHTPKFGKGHEITSTTKMDGEEYLSDSKYMKSFNKFVNEDYNPGQDDFDISSEIDDNIYLCIKNMELSLTSDIIRAIQFESNGEAEGFAESHNLSNYKIIPNGNDMVISLDSLEGAILNEIDDFYEESPWDNEEDNQNPTYNDVRKKEAGEEDWRNY